MVSKSLGIAAASLLALSGTANADVSISNKPTQNMSCDAGVCTATAQKAVLNVGELLGMLGSGDLTVKTGDIAKDISIDQPLSWTSMSRLTLDAQQSVIVNKQVTVMGQGSLTITTNDGGVFGALYFFGNGRATFSVLGSDLVIDGIPYSLVSNIKSLAAAISANPKGHFALAAAYDAHQDGTYSASPVPQLAKKGIFEGLGNSISHFLLKTDSKGGLFTANAGTIRDLRLKHARITAAGRAVGTLVPFNHGSILGCSATGSIRGGVVSSQDAGGLVGNNNGAIFYSSAAVDVSTGQYTGGLVGFNEGRVDQSFSTGTVAGADAVGGLVGYDARAVSNSYATGTVSQGHTVGGLVGAGQEEETSYSTGLVSGAVVGGFAGVAGIMEADYWNIETSGTNHGCGSGQCTNVTGLTTEQLRSGLPQGFDKRIWGQAPDINNGYPYLLANPPR